MFPLDMRTAIFSYMLISIISTTVIIFMLRQYIKRYNGVHYIIICFGLQTIALLLILLRGTLPLWITFDVANTFSIAGIVFFYIGIEKYTGNKGSFLSSSILLLLFAAVHMWFSFIKPDLGGRHLNISVVWLILFFRCTWLLLYRIPRSRVNLTLPVSLVCLAFCIICIIRIVRFFLDGHQSDNYFTSDGFDTAIIIISQLLLVLLTYSLEHMFGSQLLNDIKLEEEKFSKVFQTAPYAIILSRFADDRIIDVNNWFIKNTGYSFDEVHGKTSKELHFWQSEDDRISVIKELKESGKVYAKELRISKKSGELIVVLLTAEVIMLNNEKCIISSIDDITSRKQYEEELLNARKKAEESDSLKTAFLQNISHEIRTPMNAIVGFSTLLGEPDVTYGSKKSFIDIITKSSNHLMSIVNDILEISNIEAGILKLKKENVNVNLLLNDLLKHYEPVSIEKGIVLKLENELDTGQGVIDTDKSKLVQILSNLLDNAFKFTDNGEITFGCKLNNNDLEFHVSDTGIGIPDDKHGKIFDRFYQVDYSSGRPYEGTGLGLSILKSYIEILGGTIWLKSEAGKGTTFYFTIPA